MILVTVGMAVAAAVLVAVTSLKGPPPRDHVTDLRRIEVASASRERDPVYVESRIAVHQRLATEHGSAQALRDDVASTLRSTAVSETELRSWYESNRELFGERSFEQSRLPLERLVRIEKTQARLGLSQ